MEFGTGVDSEVRRSDIWFEDGNVVIRAEDVLFRVYRGFLAHVSPIFADLFLLAVASPDNTDSVDDCPVIRVPDSSDEFGSFMRVLFRWGYFPDDTDSASVIAAAGILRMSTKYIAHNIHSKVCVYLERQFPSQYKPFLEKYEGGVYTSFSTNGLVRLANVARETNTLAILPIVLFLLCSRTMDELLKYAFPSSNQLSLAPLNLAAVLKGRPRISLFARKHIYSFAFLNKEVPGCQTPSDCRSLNGLWVETVEQVEGWIDPFEYPPDRHGLRLIRNARCSVCRNKAFEAMIEGRERIWKAMPGLFDLQNWSELARLSRAPEGA